jgi:hypothetical protein
MSLPKLDISVTHSFGLDHTISDSMTGTRPMVRAYCYPKKTWFRLTLGLAKDDVHISWEEWDEIVRHVQALREAAFKEVVVK